MNPDNDHPVPGEESLEEDFLAGDTVEEISTEEGDLIDEADSAAGDAEEGAGPEVLVAEIVEEEIDEGEGDLEADLKEESSKAIVPARGEVLPVASDPLSRYIQQARGVADLPPEEEWELAGRYRATGDADAARELITANLKLVVKLALMYRRAFRNVWDLIQEGNVGLMEALKRFDPDQGVKFSTYAAWWAKAYMLKFLLDNARLVRVGTTNARRKLLYNLRKEQRKLEGQGIQPTTKLLAEKFGVSEEDVVEVDKALSSGDVSVDAPLGEEGSRTFADLLPAEGSTPEEQVAVQDLREKVNHALARFRVDLSERNRAILDLRLAADEPKTLQELGDMFSVTREAMRQAENKLKLQLAEFLKDELGGDVQL